MLPLYIAAGALLSILAAARDDIRQWRKNQKAAKRSTKH